MAIFFSTTFIICIPTIRWLVWFHLSLHQYYTTNLPMVCYYLALLSSASLLEPALHRFHGNPFHNSEFDYNGNIRAVSTHFFLGLGLSVFQVLRLASHHVTWFSYLGVLHWNCAFFTKNFAARLLTKYDSWPRRYYIFICFIKLGFIIPLIHLFYYICIPGYWGGKEQIIRVVERRIDHWD